MAACIHDLHLSRHTSIKISRIVLSKICVFFKNIHILPPLSCKDLDAIGQNVNGQQPIGETVLLEALKISFSDTDAVDGLVTVDWERTYFFI